MSELEFNRIKDIEWGISFVAGEMARLRTIPVNERKERSEHIHDQIGNLRRLSEWLAELEVATLATA